MFAVAPVIPTEATRLFLPHRHWARRVAQWRDRGNTSTQRTPDRTTTLSSAISARFLCELCVESHLPRTLKFCHPRHLCYRFLFMTKRIGVLLSGRGSNFEALADSVVSRRIPNAEIALVLSNREAAAGIDRARARGLATRVIPSKGLEREAYDRLVVAALNEAKVDLVCLAGYMRLLSPYFVAAFPQKILNIHPSLLPSFPGLEAQKQALDYGVKYAGCPVHFVDENLDAGPIILQAVVPVLDSDDEHTLSERILKEEHRIYTQAVKIILEGNYKIAGRRVLLG